MDKLDNEEYFEILSELDSRHGVFYHLWDMGAPVFDNEKVPRAGVYLDEEGECIKFVLNSDFWETLNFNQKLFVLCHECLHVVLNHGHRLFKNFEDMKDLKAMNYATDVVINHTLVNKFDFDRLEVDPMNVYCWTDTVFPKDPDVADNKSSEFYYNKLHDEMEQNGNMSCESSQSDSKTKQNQQSGSDPEKSEQESSEDENGSDDEEQEDQSSGSDGQSETKEDQHDPDGDSEESDSGDQSDSEEESDENGGGSGDSNEGDGEKDGEQSGDGFGGKGNQDQSNGGSNGPLTVDDHSTFIPQDSSNDNDGDSNSDNHGDNQDMSDILKDLNDRLTEEEKEFIEDLIENNADLDELKNGIDAGNSPGDIFETVEVRKVKKKKKWETVIRKWANNFLKHTDTEETQWARMNRRFQLLAGSGMYLPADMEQEDIAMEEERIEVWFFQDTSGSCSGYRQRFFDAARSLPKHRFDVKMHCFDTRVYEVDLEKGELAGFGGTSFKTIENYIQKDIAKRNAAYPGAVFVITDGYGDIVQPQKPKNWYWFLTPRPSTSYIPDKSHVFNLTDFE